MRKYKKAFYKKENDNTLLLVIDSFCSLRILFGAIFIVKLISYNIYFPNLLNQIDFCSPSRFTCNFFGLLSY